MKIEYLDYSLNIFEQTIDKDKAKVYIFNNHSNRQIAEQYYKKPFLKKESLFLTIDELKEKLFVTDRLTLKEEKKVILFYEILSKEDKKKLKVNNYFDAIDLAGDFFNFYEELNQYQIKEINNLIEWQEEKYKTFNSLREKYTKELEKRNYTDKTLKYDFDNFTLHSLKDYDELVFVNLLNFTPLEQEILRRVEEGEKRVRIINQIKKEDYNEEELRIEDLTLAEMTKPEIEIYRTDEEILELINAINIIDKEDKDYTILDSNFSDNSYSNILAAEEFELDRDIKFTATKIYRFLNSLYNLLASSDRSNGLKLDLADLLEATYLKEFREYYDLTQSDVKALNNLAKYDYVYFSEKLIDDKLLGFKAILEDITRISNFKDLNEFCSFLEGLNLKKLNDKYFVDNIDIYFGALGEINAITEMELVGSWSAYFDNQAIGLFFVILRYLKFKKIKRVENNNSGRIKVKGLLDSSYLSRDNIILLNMSEGIIPSNSTNDFLLTERQREELGLKSDRELRLEEKYKFFRHILTAKRVIIFSLKDEEKNIAVSSFVEELKLNYKLEEKEVEIKSYDELMKIAFASNSSLDIDLAQLEQNDSLKKEKADFNDGKLGMSYYKYRVLKDCYCRFYMAHLAQLEAEKVEIDNKLSPKSFGIFVHNTFEAVIKEMADKIKAKDFEIERGLIERVVKRKIKANELKLPKYYEVYYRDVLFELLKTSIEEFFVGLEKKLKDEEIVEVGSEVVPDRYSLLNKDGVEVFLNGRIDLLIKTKAKDYLIDYKTGRGSQEQLDFYELLFSDNLKEAKGIDKSIYNVMDERFNDGDNESLADFSEELSLNLKGFLASDEYIRNISSHCERCEYYELCRVVGR